MTDAPRNRHAPRRRVLKGAVIGYNDRRSTLPCTVRDLSDTGARLRTDSAINVPDTFVLIIELDGFEAECKVVWRKSPDLAVTFVAPPRSVAPTRTQVVTAPARGKVSLRRKPIMPLPLAQAAAA